MVKYSQISQDKFIFNLFNKEKGFFLDLGCGDGIYRPCGNNTYLLENNGWDGISIDYDITYINAFKIKRKTKAICVDLLKSNLKDVLIENNCPNVVDYLSFDVDQASEKALNDLPLNDYEFKIITFEHNLYIKNSIYKNLKQQAFEKFMAFDYLVLIENVELENHGPVEDWYINKKYFDAKKLKFFKNVNHKQILAEYKYD